jgi:ssDNA-binding Zn-finger/Zn-ribbon topoisomerase 1
MSEDLEGKMVRDECPECHHKLMRNKIKNEWCSNFDCDYFVRDWLRIDSIVLKHLNRKFSKSE